jgi:hypothetical protein
MADGSGSPHGARVVHHGTDELLIYQESVPDGEITLPIEERTQHAHHLGSSLPDLVDVTRPDELCIWGHPQVPSCVDPLDRFPEKRYWSGLDEALSGTSEDDRGALRDIMAILHSLKHR